MNELQMQEKIRQLRIAIINMVSKAGSGHPGGSLSAIDTIAVLFYRVMRYDPKRPKWEERDRFVLSKSHCVPALYAVLADCGYFNTCELNTLRAYGSMLQGHPCMQKTPGLEVSAGSLGQGLSIAVGMALAAKMDKKDYRTYCMVGDGESQEGQIWEAAMSAGFHKLGNLCCIVDNNRYQIDGPVKEVMDIEPIADKWRAFNWHVMVIDGHDIACIENALQQAKQTKGKPTVIIAKTIKGKGVSFMENTAEWHGMAPNNEQCECAIGELKAQED